MHSDNRFLTAPHWQRVGVHHHHGIGLPLSSIFSSSSCGIGEYLDLLPLIQWLPKTGFDLIQLLPINDTGDDPSPYMALSAHALHPIYLSLRSLPEADSVPGFLTLADTLSKLNHTSYVHYHEVLSGKLHALNLYLNHRSDALKKDPNFHAFVHANQSWLTPYSTFRTLKMANSGKAWWDWEPSATCHTSTSDQELFRWKALQYLCFSQFQQVKAAADANGVLLLGDIPILLNKDSADVWSHPELFSLKKDVGAPPDMYNEKGQHWGFPLFHWGAHRKNHFAWWKERLRVQETLYHLYRLDHLVGFFRLYAIPPGKEAHKGVFVPKTAAEWKKLGEEILSMMLNATVMLPLGEDLGDVPPLVRQSMHELGIPGMKVLRWERRWETDQSFIQPSTFSPESITTVSTHDSSTVRGWWEEDPTSSQRAAIDYGLRWEPTCTHALLSEMLRLSHQSGSLFHCNLLNEYLDLFPELSWKNPERERINLPGTLLPTNWSYRTKVSLETITHHKSLLEAMKSFLIF